MTRVHEGKVAVVTGSARGIGLACARKFAEEGARVAMLDIEQDAGENAARSLAEEFGDVAFFHCDVGDENEVSRAFAAVSEAFESVDILMNNAGINRPAEFLDLDIETFDQVIRTNLRSVFLCCQAAGRSMRDRGKGGAIVNMASTSVSMTMPNLAAYAASKGGIASITIAMALSLAPYGIRANSVGPGTIATEMTRDRLLGTEESRHRILSRTPLGRVGEGEDVANVVSFLASDAASYVTGQNIYIDGGRKGLNYTVPISS